MGLFKKKKKNNCCDVKIDWIMCRTCVYWKSEEENNITMQPPKKGNRYCDVYKTFTHPLHACALWKEEKFEATENSIQTEEINLDLDLSMEKSDLSDPRE
jgi:hypothetical protein